MHLLNEIEKAIEENNPKTFEDAVNIVIKKGWNLDTFTKNNKDILKMPAWKGYMRLIAISSSIERKNRKEANSYLQYINPGKIVIVEKGLDSNTCDILENIANKYHKQGSKEPLTLNKAKDLYGLKDWDKIVEVAINKTYEKISSENLPLSYNKLNIISPRCLLRRTYPAKMVNPTNGNKNNQDWHQDSNLIFGGKPMVTLWIPLQDGAGITRPGLEWSDLEIQYFSWKHGDGSSEAMLDLMRETKRNISTHSANVNRGSIVAFNGLTFHRTMVNTNTKEHRDALLIRFTNEENKTYFPGERKQDFALQL